MTFFRMENGNYEQKYQESNILKNTDRYTKIYFHTKTRVIHDPNNTLVPFFSFRPGTHMAEIISSRIFCQGIKIGCRTLIRVS